MEIIMANGQMAVTLSTNSSTNPSVLQGFWRVPLNPVSKIALSRKNVKENRVFCAVVANGLADSGKFIEKQFEFKPTFDDYLKAMESVKTGRETKPVGKGR
ncbi:hypothetical protein IFM89_013221 [Coptis chinensis]|uniref:Uncharacterized protein n=1 Tax=Coptis chinensis TaxID=261450 RepID=A0A835IMQ4_9MAGN|nr:hypothetical protein IFM89_013221 [Coptis chinensis]